MAGPVLYAASAGTFVAAAAASLDPTAAVLTTAAVMTALGVIWKVLKEPLRDVRNFLRSWNGQPAAPGIDAQPGLPETVTFLGKQLHEIKGRDAQLAVALEELALWAKDNGVKIDRLDERMIAVDTRVTDHRRRNDEQAAILRDDLERRAQALEAALLQRNEQVDQKLSTLSDDLLRAETMRAALIELGIDVEPPPH